VQAPAQKHIFCLNCSEIIFNPICPECIAKEFSRWIESYPEMKKARLMANKFAEKGKIFNGISQTCITCGNNNAYLCPYCFTEYLFGILKNVKADAKILSEFLLLFNFDFEHSGYYKEGEELGVF